MEFEPETPTTSSITDEQRFAAQTRTKTIQPLNPFFKPESTVVATVSETQANIAVDSETTGDPAALSQPSDKSTPTDQPAPSRAKAIISASAACVVIALAAYSAYIFG